MPKGAVKKTPLKEIRRNEAFRGLRADCAFELSSYSHYRVPVHKEKVDLNNRNDSIYNNDFLDCITQDLPCNAWSLVRDTSGCVSILRNKMWPGFAFYHKVNTNIYGNFYCGSGVKSIDLPFMF